MMSMLEKYRLAFEVSPMPLLLVSGDGIIRLTNRGLDDLFEYAPGELIGQRVEQLVPEPMRAAHPALRRAYMRVPTKRAMGQGRDLSGLTRSGDIIALELGLDPVRIGDETWALVAAVDIRHRRALDEKLRLALDASASAMLMVDVDGRITLVNRAALQMFGYDAEDLLGQPVEMLVPDAVRQVHPVYRASFLGANEARQMAADGDPFARHRSGRGFPVDVSLTPVRTPEGTLVVATIIDLTERRRTQREMAANAAELAAANVELSHFAYSASHDLKAPLATVAGLLNLCIEDIDAGDLDEARKTLHDAMDIVVRNAAKVENILRIARAGRATVVAETFALRAVVCAIWKDLTATARTLPRLDLDLGPDDRIFSEAETLTVILENLISNAIRYADETKPDPWVQVRLRRSAQGITLTVADNGLGIAA
jgi:PAS domain S-box-containing protein